MFLTCHLISSTQIEFKGQRAVSSNDRAGNFTYQLIIRDNIHDELQLTKSDRAIPGGRRGVRPLLCFLLWVLSTERNSKGHPTSQRGGSCTKPARKRETWSNGVGLRGGPIPVWTKTFGNQQTSTTIHFRAKHRRTTQSWQNAPLTDWY